MYWNRTRQQSSFVDKYRTGQAAVLISWHRVYWQRYKDKERRPANKSVHLRPWVRGLETDALCSGSGNLVTAVCRRAPRLWYTPRSSAVEAAAGGSIFTLCSTTESTAGFILALHSIDLIYALRCSKNSGHNRWRSVRGSVRLWQLYIYI